MSWGVEHPMPVAVLGTMFLAFAAGCHVSPADAANGACDAQHPCVEGRVCRLSEGICVGPEELGGPDLTDGGNPDAGNLPGQPDCVRWTQKDLGFAGTPACAGCTVEVASNNRLTSVIPNAQEGQDAAWRGAAPFVMPEASSGRLRGTFRTPPSANVEGRSSFLKLLVGDMSVIDLFVDPNFELGCESSAGALQASAVSQVASNSADRLEPGEEYFFDVVWRQGVQRTVRVAPSGGASRLLLEATLSPYSNPLGPPSELRLGIQGLTGAGSGWQVTLSDWSLCDDPNAAL